MTATAIAEIAQDLDEVMMPQQPPAGSDTRYAGHKPGNLEHHAPEPSLAIPNRED